MGNRTEQGGYPSVINPTTNPYLHIISWDGGNSYEYIPNLRDLEIFVGKGEWTKRGFELQNQFRTLTSSILPPVNCVPPPTFDSYAVAHNAVRKIKKDILVAAQDLPEANVFACSHGVYWGFMLEDEVRQSLEEGGYSVEPSYPDIADRGRKRIKVHAVIFRSPRNGGDNITSF